MTGRHRAPATDSSGAARAEGVAVELHDVRKHYVRGRETVHALRGVSLRVAPGEMVVLLGRSGSGKTTLLNCVAGWEHPDAGTVHVAPGPPGGTEWQRVAVVPQRLGLLDELTLTENVALPARLAGHADGPAAAAALLADLGLGHLRDRLPAEVSLGEQQRTAIARALVLGPRLLLADEPTGRLDEELSAQVLDTIRALCVEQGTAALVASHDPLAVEHAHRVLRLHDGQVAPGSATRP